MNPFEQYPSYRKIKFGDLKYANRKRHKFTELPEFWKTLGLMFLSFGIVFLLVMAVIYFGSRLDTIGQNLVITFIILFVALCGLIWAKGWIDRHS